MYHLFAKNEMGRINRIIREGAAAAMTDQDIVLSEINRFKGSEKRRQMLTGERYFRGDHDILKRKRQILNDDGQLEEVENLPNNRVVDNQYEKAVSQKKNYLLSKPFTIKTDNKAYADVLKWHLDKNFRRLLKNIGQDSINCGIGYVFAGYDEDGELCFERLKPYEIIPGWADADHTKLDYVIRFYEVVVYDGKNEKTVEKVEVYTKRGVFFFSLQNGKLVRDMVPMQPYFTVGEVGYNWDRIPIIPFKFNSDEIPLITKVKSLQDGINLMLSTFENNMEEDPRNSIIVVVNYGGTDSNTLRKNLATTGVLFVDSEEGCPGDVKTLSIEVNAENYKVVLEIFKKALIENAKCFDAKDDRLGSNANEMNILSMYSDIDLDADDMDMEYQASLERVLWHIDMHTYNTGGGDFEQDEVQIVFNCNILMAKSEAVEICKNSVGLVSNRTILAHHPLVEDPDEEERQIQKEKQQAMDGYADQINQLRLQGGGGNGNQ